MLVFYSHIKKSIALLTFLLAFCSSNGQEGFMLGLGPSL